MTGVDFFSKKLLACYEVSGKPIMCPECGCSEISKIVTDRIDGTPCEVFYKCSHCGESLAFWEYGHFDPCYNPHENIRR